MKVTLELSDESEIEKLFTIFQTLHFDKSKFSIDFNSKQPYIKKGNKNLNPKDLFGIWQNRPRNIEEIRNKAWKRD